MSKLKVLDLFSGIGGFSLGLERTGGFETVAFCEIEEFPRKVLAKHWPGVPIYHDVRTLTKDILDRDGIAVDVICGGFPCQDISTAGKGAGIAGERSGLWKEYARLIGELRPQFAIMENVSALLGRGLDIVLGDLAEIGFNAEWHCIPASAIGAPHRRDRIWIVANDNQTAIAAGTDRRQECLIKDRREVRDQPSSSSTNVANAYSEWKLQQSRGFANERKWIGYGSWWEIEPCVDRVAYGVSDWSHRIGSLGNAVVPQIPELIGNAILQSMRAA